MSRAATISSSPEALATAMHCVLERGGRPLHSNPDAKRRYSIIPRPRSHGMVRRRA